MPCPVVLVVVNMPPVEAVGDVRGPVGLSMAPVDEPAVAPGFVAFPRPPPVARAVAAPLVMGVLDDPAKLLAFPSLPEDTVVLTLVGLVE
jgi:hypothetical protein